MIADPTRGYEQQAERLCAAVARLNEGFWSGRARVGTARTVYAGHRRLLSDRAARRLGSLAERSDRPDSAAARALLAFVIHSRLNRRRLDCDAEIARIAATALVRAGGRSVPLGLLRTAVATEPDGRRRRELDRAADRLIAERLDGLLLEARSRQRAELAALGTSDREVSERLHGVDLDRLGEACRRFLARSEQPLREAIAAATEFGDLDTEPAHAVDLTRLLRTTVEAAATPSLDGLYAATVGALGIDPARQVNVRLDLAPRLGKSSRPFCAPLHVPGEIRLVLGPTGAWDDVPALLHETGHAQHLAAADPGARPSARLFGDRAVGESWAFLFEGLAAEPRWLTAVAGVGAVEPVRRRERLRSLLTVRRHCALLLYELELDSGPDRLDREGWSARFAELQEKALTVPVGPGRWLYGLDPSFHTAHYLRGWMLAAGWRAALRERFGEHWFVAPPAAAWLRELWCQEQPLSAEQLSRTVLGRQLGFGDLEAELLGGERSF